MKKALLLFLVGFICFSDYTLAQSTSNYEAEGSSATRLGNTPIVNFNGEQTAFFNGNSNNERIVFNFSVPSGGEYEVKINYGMPSSYGSKRQRVLVNGASQGSLQFDNSNGQFAEKSIGLFNFNGGSNTVEVAADWGYMHINRLTIVGTSQGPVSEFYQAEFAQIFGNTQVSSLSGEGTTFFNGNSNNERVVFSFPVNTSGTYALKLNYGMPNGYGSKRQFVFVNGQSQGSLNFQNTNGGLADLDLGEFQLNQGTNTVEVRADWGYMHLNWLVVTGPNDDGGGGGGGGNPNCPGVPFNVEGFFVANGKLWDNNCNEFVIRGINHQYGDQVSFIPNDVKGAIPKIRSVGKANTVRIQLRNDSNDGKGVTSASDIKDAVDLCTNNQMVPMLMMYSNSATCGNNLSALQAAVDRWVQLASSSGGDLDRYPNFRKYGIINITNEFGIDNTPNFNSWKNAYKNAITAIRNAGYTNPIVIDAHQCAQDINVFLGSDGGGKSRAQELLDQDWLSNIIFSAHAYNFKWNTDQKIRDQIRTMEQSGYNWVFGEHGNTQFEAPNNDVNNTLLWRLCEEANPKVGWVAWAWCSGNGSCCVDLNMSGAWVPNSFNQLLPYGQQVVSSTYGLQNTADIASVFYNNTSRVALLSPQEISAPSIQVYPNPFRQKLSLASIGTGTYQISLLDLSGQEHFNKVLEINGQSDVDFGDLPSGTYLIKIRGEGINEIRRVIKR